MLRWFKQMKPYCSSARTTATEGFIVLTKNTTPYMPLSATNRITQEVLVIISYPIANGQTLSVHNQETERILISPSLQRGQ